MIFHFQNRVSFLLHSDIKQALKRDVSALVFFLLFEIVGFDYFLTTGYDFMDGQVASAA